MSKTKEEIRKVLNYEEKYDKNLKGKIRIYTKDNPDTYVGNIIESIIGRIQISETVSYEVPIIFMFEIKDPTNPNNGDIVDINTFSITDIEYLSIHYQTL